MAQLTVQAASVNGLTPTYVAASAGGDTFSNQGTAYLFVKNGGATSINVVLDSQAKCNHGFDHDLTIAVPAGEEKLIGPIDPSRFNDPTGLVHATYSDVTSVTVAVVRA